MDWLQALILGLVQGLTEYLPVSSSGHLEIGKVLLGPEAEAGGLTFDIVVHVATVLSTLVILWKEIGWIFKGLFKFQWNDETRYASAIVISMIPIGIVGLFFKDSVEALYANNVLFVVGACLLITAALHFLTHFFPNGFVSKPKEKVSFLDAFIIGIAQALAVLPGLVAQEAPFPQDFCLATTAINLRSSLSLWSYRPFSAQHLLMQSISLLRQPSILLLMQPKLLSLRHR